MELIDNQLRNILRPGEHSSGKTPAVPRISDREFRESLNPIPLPPEHGVSGNKDILLIPIFNGWGATESYARIGAWVFYSFLSHSDAIEQGVDVKFYIEETALDSVSDVLRENHICLEKDVLTFEWRHTDYYSISQKLQTLCDDWLLSYENIFVADADTFAMPSMTGERLQLFSKLKNEQRSLCSVIPQQDITFFSVLCRIFSGVVKTKPKEIGEFMKCLEHSEYLSKNMWHHPISVPITWMFMFKPCLLRHEYPTFRKWFDDYGYRIYTDEEVLGIGSLLGHIAFGTDLAHRYSVKIGSLKTQEACIRHGEMNRPDDIEEFYRRIL